MKTHLWLNRDWSVCGVRATGATDAHQVTCWNCKRTVANRNAVLRQELYAARKNLVDTAVRRALYRSGYTARDANKTWDANRNFFAMHTRDAWREMHA